ncbi:MAG TPA: ABC transporter ATP-binding protein [Tepidisphaeraceae bacterium]|nr:ABC transporter ATP-binding protein [Tepidisphaeraceae bacterium]
MSSTSNPDRDGSRVFLRILRLLRPHWGMIALGMAALLLSVPGELFPALVWKYVTDDLILRGHSRPTPVLATLISFHGWIHNSMALLVWALAWMFIVYLSGEVLGTISANLMNRVAQKFIFTLRNRVYDKLQSQSLGYLQRQRLGDLISRAMSDVDELQSFIVNGIDQIIGDGVLWLATVVIVVLIDWRVASVSLLPLMVVYILLRVFNARIKPIYTAARERLGDVTTRLQENLAGVVVIKIFGREKQEGQRFYDATEGYYRQQIRAINARSVFFSFTRIVGFFSNVFMLGMGGFLILRGGGSFTVGKLIVFRAYWWRLYGPVQTLARVNDMVQRAMAAARRVFEILDAPHELPDSVDAAPLAQVSGGIALEHVTFRYPNEVNGRESPVVLRDLSLRIEPGQTVALCGPSGSGKSTVLNLLLRFYDPFEGRVTLDGRDLRQIRRDSFRRHFALVQQETFLFNDSILDNIRYGHAEASMEQVVAAAKAANAHAFISALPNGYETRVGERGVRLSGGQKQRISIARAFLANPTVLLLDEPTSSVEPDSEATIIAALDRLMAGRTTVLTSHRPSLINQADAVYVIQDGRLTEYGAIRDLRESNGWFARFMRSAEEALPEMA